jgi:hypothetical protein
MKIPLLYKKMFIKKYITNMLEFDKKQAPFTIIGFRNMKLNTLLQ